MTNEEPEKKTARTDHREPLLPGRNRDGEARLDKFKGASFSGSVFNLSCAIIGAGIMSLPATIKLLGVVLGVVLIIVAALLTEASIEMLLRFSKPGASFSYGDVMGDAFGMFGKMSLQLCVVVNNIGVVIIYLIIICDVLSGSTSSAVHHAGVLEGWFGEHWWTGRAFLLIVLTVVVFIPLICFKRIDSLRHTSAISIALAVVFLVIVIGITIYKLMKGTIERPRWYPSATDLASLSKLFTAFPVIVCSYVCHYNVHTIKNELQESPRMQSVVQASLTLCAVLYTTTGVFGFLLFGNSTLPDVLSNFDTNLGIPYSSLINDIVRVSYAFHIILIFPIVFHPLRLNLDSLLFASARPLSTNNLRFALISMGLIIIVLLGAIVIPNIWVVFQFVGTTASFLIAFIFPAFITLKDPHGIAKRIDKILSIFLIILSVCANSIAIYSNAYSLLN